MALKSLALSLVIGIHAAMIGVGGFRAAWVGGKLGNTQDFFFDFSGSQSKRNSAQQCSHRVDRATS
jgi:hypothetical protein